MAPIPDGFAEIRWILGGVGLPYGAMMTMAIDVTVTAETGEELVELAETSYGTSLKSHVTSFVSLVRTDLKYGPDATGPTYTRSSAIPGTAGVVDSLPNTAYLIRKVTSQGGRSGRGRLYMPGVLETKIANDGSLDPTVRTNLTTGWNTVRTNFEAVDAPFVVLHDPGAPLSVPTPVDTIQVDGKVATQRRRLRR